MKIDVSIHVFFLYITLLLMLIAAIFSRNFSNSYQANSLPILKQNNENPTRINIPSLKVIFLTNFFQLLLYSVI